MIKLIRHPECLRNKLTHCKQRDLRASSVHRASGHHGIRMLSEGFETGFVLESISRV